MTTAELHQITKQFNGPLYVYDAAIIKAQYERLTNAFQGVNQLRIHYATKALNNISILKYIQSLGAGLDTVSIQEVKLGLKAGFEHGKLFLHPTEFLYHKLKKLPSLEYKSILTISPF